MVRLKILIGIVFLFFIFPTAIMSQPKIEKPLLIKRIQDPIKSKFRLIDNKLFFTFTFPNDVVLPNDSSISVYLKTTTVKSIEEHYPKLKFDAKLREYQFEVGSLEKSATGEIYIQYSPSKDIKALHFFPYSFYVLNGDNYSPKKLLQVYSKDGVLSVDFVKHDESILMPIIVATIDEVPGKLPLNFKQRGKAFQVSFIDKKTASFGAYVSIFFDADKNDSKTRILQFNEENKSWFALKTRLHDKGVNAPIEKLGFFVLAEEVR